MHDMRIAEIDEVLAAEVVGLRRHLALAAENVDPFVGRAGMAVQQRFEQHRDAARGAGMGAALGRHADGDAAHQLPPALPLARPRAERLGGHGRLRDVGERLHGVLLSTQYRPCPGRTQRAFRSHRGAGRARHGP